MYFKSCNLHEIFYDFLLLKSLPKNQEYTKTFVIALRKSCLSHKLFVTLSLVAKSRQKGRSKVSKCFMWFTFR